MIKINDIQIKEPSKFKIEGYNLTKSGRLSSGKMTMDIIAKKKKLFFTYNVISGTALEQILDLIDSDEPFFEVEYEENNKIYKITAYASSIPRELWRRGEIGGEWYWKGVEFDLIEQ